MLQARQSQVTASREESARAAALPDPQLTLGLANWPVTGADAFDFRTDDMTMKQVGLMQEFPARAKRQARQAVADRTVEQAQALSVAERLAVRQAVAQAWIALWAAQREVAALQALQEPTDVAVRAARARLAGGTGSAVDAMATQNAALELENRIDATPRRRWKPRVPAWRAGWVKNRRRRIDGAPPELDDAAGGPGHAAGFARSTRAAVAKGARARPSPKRESKPRLPRNDRTEPRRHLRAARAHTRSVSRSDMLMVEFAIDLPLFPRNRQDRGGRAACRIGRWPPSARTPVVRRPSACA